MAAGRAWSRDKISLCPTVLADESAYTTKPVSGSATPPSISIAAVVAIRVE
jgi:hypothetical protein